MKKRDWKRSLAFLCATALIAGSLSEFGPLTRVKAEETNLFMDGDMGDDEMGDSTDAANFWANQKWYFEGNTWDCTSQVKYSIWAKQAAVDWRLILIKQMELSACIRKSVRWKPEAIL